ncbi:MAG: hypothetical protein DGJ47_001168 [Rickettsiaceae bacterium]
MFYKKESEIPLTKEELTDVIFDTTYAMDMSNDENVKSYDCLKLKYIALFEGEEKRAYDDAVGPKNPYKYASDIFSAGRTPVGKITVGAGFNMDRPEARAEWESVFGGELDFDKVYEGKKQIEDHQIIKLLKCSVDPREKELGCKYGETWTYLRPNEKIVIISAYYNGPSLVNEKTRFYSNMKKYIETNDPEYLKEAKSELGEKSKKDPSLISRRKLEAKLLDSTKSPFYVKPRSDKEFKDPIKVIQGETKLPRDIESYTPTIQNSEFVIWRTNLDDRVRADHMRMEGKVYHRDYALQIKGEYGCRCKLVDIPNNLIIMDDKSNIISSQFLDEIWWR